MREVDKCFKETPLSLNLFSLLEREYAVVDILFKTVFLLRLHNIIVILLLKFSILLIIVFRKSNFLRKDSEKCSEAIRIKVQNSIVMHICTAERVMPPLLDFVWSQKNQHYSIHDVCKHLGTVSTGQG